MLPLDIFSIYQAALVVLTFLVVLSRGAADQEAALYGGAWYVLNMGAQDLTQSYVPAFCGIVICGFICWLLRGAFKRHRERWLIDLHTLVIGAMLANLCLYFYFILFGDYPLWTRQIQDVGAGLFVSYLLWIWFHKLELIRYDFKRIKLG